MAKELAEKFELAVRIALFIFTLSVGIVVILAGAKNASAASLKSEGVITGDYIKLGDVFDGVENAEYVLGPAPQPGKDMILNARTLYKIASALDVSWSPSTSSEQLILRREAAVIPMAEVTAQIEERLKKDGIDGKFSVKYMNEPSDIILPGGSAETIEITDISYNPQNDNFNAVVVSPSAENPLRRLSVSGRVERLIPVPVLFNSLKNGDVISARDIDWIDLPENKIANGTIMEEKDLINMTPRRLLAGGRTIIANDLERPKMVGRGDAVTLVFENGAMVLMTKGKALQDGAIGDMVRVSNMDSNKSLQGVVTADREITIR